MKTITTDRTPDIPGYMLPGSSAQLVTELEGVDRLLNEQIRMARRLQLDEIDLDSARDERLQRNRKLVRRHEGETCFIVGGGPSLSEVDIAEIERHRIFGLNALFQLPTCPRLDYHVAADGNFFQAVHADGASKKPYFEKFLQVCRETEFLTAYQFRETIVEHQLLPEERAYFVRFYPFALSHGIDRDINLEHGMPATQNVAQFAIICALAMGFQNIVLLGIDHDFPVGGTWKHSYDKPESGKRNPLRQNSNGDLMWFTWQMWMGYQHIENYATARGIRIVNASHRSNLDVFEYADYSEFV